MIHDGFVRVCATQKVTKTDRTIFLALDAVSLIKMAQCSTFYFKITFVGKIRDILGAISCSTLGSHVIAFPAAHRNDPIV